MNRNLYYEDELIEHKFNLFMLKRIVFYSKEYKKKYVLILILLIANSLLALLPVTINKKIIDQVLPKDGVLQQEYLKKAVIFLLLWSVISLCYVVMNYISSKITNVIGNDIICKLRSDVFKQLMKLEFDYYDSRPTGKILVRVTNYTDEIANFFINDMTRVVQNVFVIILCLVMIFIAEIRIGWITCMMSIPLFVLIWFLSKSVYRRVQIDRNKYSNRTAFIAENINGLEVIQAFNRADKNEMVFKELSKQYLDAYMRTTRVRELFYPLSHGVVQISFSIVIYLAALWLITNHIGSALTLGTIALVTTYIQNFSNAMNVICERLQNLTNVTSNIERVFDILDTKEKIVDSEDAVDLQEVKGDVEFKDVCFSYDNTIPVLDHFSLSVKAGEMVALTGPTGAGKTTIVSLLSRFYEVGAGKITIDGIDIKQIRLHSLRENVGVMMQDSFLFSGTVMDNIRFAKPDATEEECIAAAKQVCAHEFIEKMEKGYDTVISSQNTEISAGERQLISFARLLLANPKIVILDEATSNIDTETELLIQQVFDRVLKGRTSFVIAHRLSTIQNADRILHIDS